MKVLLVINPTFKDKIMGQQESRKLMPLADYDYAEGSPIIDVTLPELSDIALVAETTVTIIPLGQFNKAYTAVRFGDD